MKKRSRLNSVGVSSTRSSAAPHLARLLVQDEVGEAQQAVLVLAARPAQHRPHARDDLGQAERLRHVVVAEREPGDLVLGRVASP